MPISIDYQAAEQVLLDALAIASSDRRLPVEWRSHARTVFALESKTWTPAFATMLLAKATDSRVDTMSLKAESGNPYAYSARSLCHKILVPAAVNHNFSIRNKGPEPLNNQPFFRYDRIDKIDRVRKPVDREYFFDVVEQANKLSADQALDALAAFLREALAVAAATRSVSVKAGGLTAHGAKIAVEDFLRDDAPDRPRRLQAFAAACLDLIHQDVKSRRINDPSAHVPGDVQVLLGKVVAMSMEVKGKTVKATDLTTFADECKEAGVERAVMFVDAPQQVDLNLDAAVIMQRLQTPQVVFISSAAELLSGSLLWAPLPLEKAIEAFSKNFLDRLLEIEVTVPTLEEWGRAATVAQARLKGLPSGPKRPRVDTDGYASLAKRSMLSTTDGELGKKSNGPRSADGSRPR
ncbi:restriction endonuclease, SacI family [Mycetocola spongiae]|uniref:restriction endonuclease, SacI family n=1 Tax=Mycetocola spongiae TaxID=2859226 RepID=UPI001CF512FF|nr:restriction endonuclease, SacI family [Mycetocola spongiae]UCR88079.1 restriction endonuclease, SacI family [Mycetocola spongiae]